MYDNYDWVGVLYDIYLEDLWDAYCTGQEDEYYGWMILRTMFVEQGLGL